ncbi:MAG: hypothetical protein AAGG01_05545 [Planctomycetota bacterium]
MSISNTGLMMMGAVGALGILLLARASDSDRQGETIADQPEGMAHQIESSSVPEGDCTSRVPASSGASDVSGEDLESLSSLIAAGNGSAAGDYALAWFEAQGEEAGARLLELMASHDEVLANPQAVSVLARVATHLLVTEPERMLPWTTDTFTAASLELLGVHAEVPSVLFTAFAEIGAHLEPERMVDLLDSLRARSVGPATTSQATCLQLAYKWSKSMPEGVENLLLDRVAAQSLEPFARSDAAALLLERNWRSTTASLLDAVQETQSATGRSALEHIIGTHVSRLNSHEQAEYFRELAATPGLALSLAWHMNPDAASMALAQPSDKAGQGFPQLMLALRAGEIVGEDQILQLATHETLNREVPSLTWFAMGQLLRSDAAYRVGLPGRILKATSHDSAARERVLEALSREVATLEQEPLLAVVLPILDETRTDESRGRMALLRSLRGRFPEMHLE